MKKTLLVFSFVIFFLNSKAQTSVYHPFPDSGIVWREEYGGLNFNCCCGGNCVEYKHFEYFLGGDTIIGSYHYKKILQTGKQIIEISGPTSFPICTSCSETFYMNADYVGGMRQDTLLRKVFFVTPSTNQDTLLYDFSLKVGDTLPPAFNNYPETNYISSIDSVLIGNSYHKRFWLANNISLIEGIGSTTGLLFILRPCFEFCNNLVCVTINSIPVYPDTATVCALVSTSDERNLENSISISPNPTSKNINIRGHHLSGNAIFEIHNMLGEKVFQSKITYPKSEFQLDVSSLIAGIYLITLSDGEKIYRGKLVKN